MRVKKEKVFWVVIGIGINWVNFEIGDIGINL